MTFSLKRFAVGAAICPAVLSAVAVVVYGLRIIARTWGQPLVVVLLIVAGSMVTGLIFASGDERRSAPPR